MGDVLQIIGCGCSPTRHVGHLVALARRAGWVPYVTLTPSATKWAPVTELERLTGHPVRSEHRAAGETKPVPECDAVVVCPATVNTVNKWAAGICDTLALGALVEAVGRRLPVVAVPYGSAALRGHPAFGAAVRNLREWGSTCCRSRTTLCTVRDGCPVVTAPISGRT